MPDLQTWVNLHKWAGSIKANSGRYHSLSPQCKAWSASRDLYPSSHLLVTRGATSGRLFDSTFEGELKHMPCLSCGIILNAVSVLLTIVSPVACVAPGNRIYFGGKRPWWFRSWKHLACQMWIAVWVAWQEQTLISWATGVPKSGQTRKQRSTYDCF